MKKYLLLSVVLSSVFSMDLGESFLRQQRVLNAQANARNIASINQSLASISASLQGNSDRENHAACINFGMEHISIAESKEDFICRLNQCKARYKEEWMEKLTARKQNVASRFVIPGLRQHGASDQTQRDLHKQMNTYVADFNSQLVELSFQSGLIGSQTYNEQLIVLEEENKLAAESVTPKLIDSETREEKRLKAEAAAKVNQERFEAMHKASVERNLKEQEEKQKLQQANNRKPKTPMERKALEMGKKK